MKLDACRNKVDLRVIYAGLCSEGKNSKSQHEYFMNAPFVMILKKGAFPPSSKPHFIFATLPWDFDIVYATKQRKCSKRESTCASFFSDYHKTFPYFCASLFLHSLAFAPFY